MRSRTTLATIEAQATLLTLVDHLERIAVTLARLLLDLAEDNDAAATAEEIDLDAGQADVGAEDSVAAQAVVSARTALGRGAGKPGGPHVAL